MRALSAALQDEAEDHLRELARRYNIELHFSSKEKTANAVSRQAWAPWVRTALDYVAGLHELGHVASRRARDANRRESWTGSADDGLACEAYAWGWAIERAHQRILDRMTAEMWKVIGLCWLSYVTQEAGGNELTRKVMKWDYDEDWPTP